MNYLVIAVCMLAIIMAIVCKINGFSMFIPTLIIIFAVISNIIVNTIAQRKSKKEYTNLEEIKKKMKNKS